MATLPITMPTGRKEPPGRRGGEIKRRRRRGVRLLVSALFSTRPIISFFVYIYLHPFPIGSRTGLSLYLGWLCVSRARASQAKAGWAQLDI